jgi:glycosyltransferase involved in cell wall biosynthesis
MASRLVPWKGHEIFLESVSLLSKRNTNLKFLIVGGTTFGRANYLDRLKKISAKLGIAEKVVFTDFVYKVADMLSVIDILVHASIRPEPFGLDIVEAMFLGKVVVASDTGAPREIIDDDKDGILFKPADTVALAEILQRLLDLPQKRIELGENAKIKAKEKFTAERFAKDFEKVIKMSEVKS